MNVFQHIDAVSVENAVSLLGSPGAVLIAGGTDLLTRIKSAIIRPTLLVNIKNIPGLDRIDSDDRGLRLGALATLTDIAAAPVVKSHYASLAQAINVAASPQLRNFATIGGNLMQGSRCWYYRGNFPCWLKGGAKCFARDGENNLHAVFAGGPCYTVHPSDPAVALVALDAQITISGPGGARQIPVAQLFERPSVGNRAMTILAPGEIITNLTIPRNNTSNSSIYLKAMERRVWAFALASTAVNIAMDNGLVTSARVVLGGVASMPLRAAGAEAVLLGCTLTDDDIAQACQAAVNKANPLAKNSYKVDLVKGLLQQALLQIREGE